MDRLPLLFSAGWGTSMNHALKIFILLLLAPCAFGGWTTGAWDGSIRGTEITVTNGTNVLILETKDIRSWDCYMALSERCRAAAETSSGVLAMTNTYRPRWYRFERQNLQYLKSFYMNLQPYFLAPQTNFASLVLATNGTMPAFQALTTSQSVAMASVTSDYFSVTGWRTLGDTNNAYGWYGLKRAITNLFLTSPPVIYTNSLGRSWSGQMSYSGWNDAAAGGTKWSEFAAQWGAVGDNAQWSQDWIHWAGCSNGYWNGPNSFAGCDELDFCCNRTDWNSPSFYRPASGPGEGISIQQGGGGGANWISSDPSVKTTNTPSVSKDVTIYWICSGSDGVGLDPSGYQTTWKVAWQLGSLVLSLPLIGFEGVTNGTRKFYFNSYNTASAGAIYSYDVGNTAHGGEFDQFAELMSTTCCSNHYNSISYGFGTVGSRSLVQWNVAGGFEYP